MSADQTFENNGWKIRPATEDDLPLIREWVAADPIHRGKIPAEHFIQQAKLVDSFVIEDESGEALFFRFDRAVRCTIQFGPAATEEQKNRTREAMTEGLGMMEVLLAMSGTREILFDSQDRVLRAFCQRQLKFSPKIDTLSKTLPILAPPAQYFQRELSEAENVLGDQKGE